jgi:transposase, IS30 family
VRAPAVEWSIMKNYSHLNREERRFLSALMERGDSLRSIAQALGRSHSSLSRELKRNLKGWSYHPFEADRWARIRRNHGYRHRYKLADPALKRKVKSALRKGWSPELMAGRFKLRAGTSICAETIYRWIYRDARDLIRYLTRHHLKRGKYRLARAKYPILGRVSVSNRPDEANRRTQVGHWEVDLIIGKGSSALKVAVDRQSRFTRIAKVPDKTAQSSFAALYRILSSLPPSTLRSITYDNGIENALHKEINRRFHTRSFFCHPYRFWEKPTVENTNGLIRRFLPKRTNFDIIPDSQIQAIQHWLNSRPRKCLHLKHPLKPLVVHFTVECAFQSL